MQLKLSENIKLLRNRKGITQDALAEKMKVTVQAVSKWETGNSCPEISLLPDLADFFGVTVDDLLTGTQAQTKQVKQAQESATMAYFPDDGTYRVAEFFGAQLIKESSAESSADSGRRLILDVSELDKRLVLDDKLLFQIMGSAKIEGDVKGSVTAEGYVECGPVGGSVSANDYVQCGPVGGGVSAGDSVECGDVGGDVSGGDSVACGNVKGDVSAGDSVECADVEGDVYAGDSVECGDVGGDVHASGVACGNARGGVYVNENAERGRGGGNIIFGNAQGAAQGGIKKNPAHAHPMTYVLDLGAAGNIRFNDNTPYGDSTISTRQACVDFTRFIREAENPPQIGDTVRVTGRLISPIDIDKLLVGLVDNSREADYWLVLDKDGENYLKQNTYVCGLKAGEAFALDVSLPVKKEMRRSFAVQLAYGEQSGGCVTMEAHKVSDVVCA